MAPYELEHQLASVGIGRRQTEVLRQLQRQEFMTETCRQPEILADFDAAPTTLGQGRRFSQGWTCFYLRSIGLFPKRLMLN